MSDPDDLRPTTRLANIRPEFHIGSPGWKVEPLPLPLPVRYAYWSLVAVLLAACLGLLVLDALLLRLLLEALR